jgi:hypothetical protein
MGILSEEAELHALESGPRGIGQLAVPMAVKFCSVFRATQIRRGTVRVGILISSCCQGNTDDCCE